ncbi:hypothetical protein IH992_18320 [Candidatus Poribacteria bacterium]|nr:hypothetical protein [Candidatus Poribacteria bacterium]
MREKFRLYHTTKNQLRQWVDLSEPLTCVMTWFVIGFMKLEFKTQTALIADCLL